MIPAGIESIDHAALKQQLSDVYAAHNDCCTASDQLPTPNLSDDDEVDKMITALIRSIFKNRSISSIPDDLYNYFVDQVWEAVNKGFAVNVDYEAADQLMLDALYEDVVRFSAAKDDVMNRAMYRELVGADGKIRSFSEFRQAAYDIAGEHVGPWLKAEYNLAITSAQAASKWVKIDADKQTLPLLQFDAIIDGRTTEICRNFDGVTLPVDHPFWDQYYIPNHWGERSTIRQLEDGEATDISTIIYPEKIPAMFKVNLAKQKKIFPPDHPYYNGK